MSLVAQPGTPSRPSTPPSRIINNSLRTTFSLASTATSSSFIEDHSASSSPSSSFVSNGSPLKRPITPPSPSPSPEARQRSCTPAPSRPSLDSLSSISIKRPSPRTSCFTKLAFLLWIITAGFFVWWQGWHTRNPPPIPLESIAHVTAQHVTLGAEVVKDLADLRDSCSWRDIRAAELDSLSVLTRPHSARAADSLLVTAQTATQLSNSLTTPNIMVLAHFYDLELHVTTILKNLKSILARRPSRVIQSELIISDEVDSYLAHTVPFDLKELRVELDLQQDRCEIIFHQRDRVVPELRRIQKQLGLVKPWLPWNRRAWENDPTVQEGLRLVQSMVDTFDSIDRFRVALGKSRESVKKYLDADIFEKLQHYPKNGLSLENVSLGDYIQFISKSLHELQSLIREARAKNHA
ncbi:hypothetical protein FRC04_003401 [Tulasnella sp. 424]|nr:hypothetical protein FRC04_003401 [Tulasnella sp. 424]KAG8977213.1 hypothetical protein FRC05_002213 [Tulasnella sp. 425]